MIQISGTHQPAYTPAQVNALIAAAAGIQIAMAVPVIVNQGRPVAAAVLAAAGAALALVVAAVYGWRSRMGAPAPRNPNIHVLVILLGCGALLWPALVMMLWPSAIASLLGLALGALWIALAGLVLFAWR